VISRHRSSSASPGVVVVGDVLVDVIEQPEGDPITCAGGAGLNLAVGVHRLGTTAALAAPMSQDRLGSWLRAAAAEEGVVLVPLACSRPTGIATSRRDAGEPFYEFSDSVHQRHFEFTEADVEAMSTGTVLVVNSFPINDRGQVEALIEVAQRTERTFVVDPNVRPTLVNDVSDYRAGLRMLASAAHVIKLSLQDIAHLEAGPPQDYVAELLDLGVGVVVLTRAEQGATLYTARGPELSVPASDRTQPVVDTMGAGDAALARLVCGLAEYGTDLSENQWRTVLGEAMELAADICRIEGGNLSAIRPTEWNDR
jgi:fructokinase